jgi:hypothetical protein
MLLHDVVVHGFVRQEGRFRDREFDGNAVMIEDGANCKGSIAIDRTSAK